MLDSRSLSIIDDCNIHSNENLFDTWDSEISDSCDKLCFLTSEQSQLYNSIGDTSQSDARDESLFQIISSSLRIQNSTCIYNQGKIMNMFVSDVEVVDSIIENINVSESMIIVTSSTFDLINTTLINIYEHSDAQLMFMNLESKLKIFSCNFIQINSQLITSRNSDISINDLLLSDIVSNSTLVQISRSNQVVIGGLNTHNITLTSGSIFEMSNLNNVELSEFNFLNIKERILTIQSSNIDLIHNFRIIN